MKKLTLLSFIVLLFGCESDTPQPIVNDIVDSENALPSDEPVCEPRRIGSLSYIHSGGGSNSQYSVEVGYDHFFALPPPKTVIDLIKDGALIGRIHTIDHNVTTCSDNNGVRQIFNMDFVPFYGTGFECMANGEIVEYRRHRNKIDITQGSIISELVNLQVREKGTGNSIPIADFIFRPGKIYEFSAYPIGYNDGDYFNYQVYIKFPDMIQNNSFLFRYKSDGADLDKWYTSEKTFPYPLLLPQYEVQIDVILEGRVFQSYTKTVQVPG